jgi:hypothetical protein
MPFENSISSYQINYSGTRSPFPLVFILWRFSINGCRCPLFYSFHAKYFLSSLLTSTNVSVSQIFAFFVCVREVDTFFVYFYLFFGTLYNKLHVFRAYKTSHGFKYYTLRDKRKSVCLHVCSARLSTLS